MKVRWNDQAKAQLRNTSYYILRKFGKSTRDIFLLKVRQTNKLLGSNPFLGKVEPLLYSRPIKYLSIVTTPINKMIYHIKENHIEVVAFWDTRREPKNLIKDLEKTED